LDNLTSVAILADPSKATFTADPGRATERPETPLGQRLVFEALTMGVEYVYASAVPGHIAEFGTMSGATATTLANAMRDGDQRYRLSERSHGIGERLLYLFDSFEGFPKTDNPVDAASPHVSTNVWGPGVARGLTASDLHDACAAIVGRDRVKVTPGWFNETLPRFSDDLRFALVSIDCDLYESTASVLEYLLGKQTYSDGCALFFDDWYCNRGSPQFGEQKAWADYTLKYKTQFTDWGPYSVVGRKFILHR
jgi:O-methyltransferase